MKSKSDTEEMAPASVDDQNIARHRELGNTNWHGFSALIGTISVLAYPDASPSLRIIVIVAMAVIAIRGLRRSAGSKLLSIIALTVIAISLFTLLR